MNPLVSVIIPVYKTEKYIAAALDSVLNQSVADFEVIIINDGSPDNSAEVISPYLKDARLKYLEQANAGVSTARNTGIAHSSGRYIAFLDSDDTWHPRKLEKQLRYFESHPECALVHGKIEGIDLNGKPVDMDKATWYPNEQQTKMTGHCYKELFMHNLIATVSVMLRKEILVQTGEFRPDLNISEDYDLWLKIARQHSIGFINETLAYYRLHGTGLTKNWLEVDRSTSLVLEGQLSRDPSIRTDIGDDIISARLGMLYRTMAYELSRTNQHIAARPYWKKILARQILCPECYVNLAYGYLPASFRRNLSWYFKKIRAIRHD